VRTGAMGTGRIELRENSVVHLAREPVVGSRTAFNLYPGYVGDELRIGDLLRVDADVLVRVVDRKESGVVARVLNGGVVGRSKAVTVLGRDIDMPPLTDKDRQALEIGKDLGIRHVALSFANRATDVDAVREVAGDDVEVISKIECLNGLRNLAEIATRSQALLIDRGDLSRQVSLEQLPGLQKDIIRYGRDCGVRVYVATNLMESMVTAPMPTRAEVNDVYNTLVDGAAGLVLAAETAVGAYPVGAAMMVARIIRAYEQSAGWRGVRFAATPAAGEVCVPAAVVPRARSQERRVVEVAAERLLDCWQIANGTCAPLTGFMDRDQLESVLTEGRLPGGAHWPMPMILPVSADLARSVGRGEEIVVCSDERLGTAILRVRDVYALDLESIGRRWFGTDANEHPGVASMLAAGTHAIAADVLDCETSITRFPGYELQPAEARMVFEQKGWTKVVAAPTRAVADDADGQRDLLRLLANANADGLYLPALVARRGADEVRDDLVLKSHALVLGASDGAAGRVVLGALSTADRHCPEREVLFDAIRLRNLGCTHFVLGVGYPSAAQVAAQGRIVGIIEQCEEYGIGATWSEPMPQRAEARSARSANAPAQLA
jgi:ATP sulfurylase